jgi:hypothetical protein
MAKAKQEAIITVAIATSDRRAMLPATRRLVVTILRKKKCAQRTSLVRFSRKLIHLGNLVVSVMNTGKFPIVVYAYAT